MNVWILLRRNSGVLYMTHMCECCYAHKYGGPLKWRRRNASSNASWVCSIFYDVNHTAAADAAVAVSTCILRVLISFSLPLPPLSVCLNDGGYVCIRECVTHRTSHSFHQVNRCRAVFMAWTCRFSAHKLLRCMFIRCVYCFTYMLHLCQAILSAKFEAVNY